MKFCSYHGQCIVSSLAPYDIAGLFSDISLYSIIYGYFQILSPFLCFDTMVKDFDSTTG